MASQLDDALRMISDDIEKKLSEKINKAINRLYDDVPKHTRVLWEGAIEEDFYAKYKPRSYKRTRKAKNLPIREIKDRDNEYGIEIDTALMSNAYRHHGKSITSEEIFENTLRGIHGYVGSEIWPRRKRGGKNRNQESREAYEVRANAATRRREAMLTLANMRSERYIDIAPLGNTKASNVLTVPSPKQSADLVNSTQRRFNKYLQEEIDPQIEKIVDAALAAYRQ